MNGYGMSETSGPQTLSTISNWRLGSAGCCLNGTQLKIDKPDENGEGEVSTRKCEYSVEEILPNFLAIELHMYIIIFFLFLVCRFVCTVVMCSWVI